MKYDKVQALIAKYPRLFNNRHDVSCPDGWYHLVDTLCAQLDFIVESLPPEMQGQIYVQQVKSKFGGLRFYVSHSTPKMDGAIALAEDLSNNMCEMCGVYAGHKNIDGWFATLCDKHYKQMKKERGKK